MLLETEPFKPKGRLAHLMLEDFLTGSFGKAQHDGDENIDPIFFRCQDLRDPQRQNEPVQGHKLLMIETQSFGVGEDADELGVTVLSTLCEHCRHHFVFEISQSTSGFAPTKDNHPLHHFIIKHVEGSPHMNTGLEEAQSKLYPLVSRAQLECSMCKQTVNIEMTTPRLRPEWIRKLTDETRIKAQFEIVQAEDPTRFADTDGQRMASSALDTLSAYLRDLLGSDKPRRISLRNKRFSIQFGPACDDIFKHLEFTQEVDEGELKWVMPRLPPASGKTILRSLRAFFEDARSEVQSVMVKDPTKSEELRPFPGLEKLEKALGCENRNGRIREKKSDRQLGDWPRILGTTADSTDDVFIYAYKRQKATDTENKQVYMAALQEVAMKLNSFELQILSTEEKSAETAPIATGTTPLSDIELAYKQFGLKPDCNNDDRSIIGLYNNYRSQSGTSTQKSQHRQALFKLARARKSETILAEAVAPMDLTEACAFLEVQSDWDLETIVALVQAVKSGSDDTDLAVAAMEAIARERPNDPNLAMFESNIEAMKSQSAMDRWKETDLGEASEKDKILSEVPNAAANKDFPAGLGNLRNTCYLNSILQYFYSVSDVRNLALTFAAPELQPSQEVFESLLSQSGKLGALEPGRAFVGTEFAKELQILFFDLQNAEGPAVTPRQRLANAALLRPDKSRSVPVAESKSAGSDSATQDKKPLPPLPPRKSDGPTVTVDAIPATDNDETASNVSSQTLVDQIIDQGVDDSTYVVVDREGDKAEEGIAPETEMTDVANGAAVSPEKCDSAVDVEPAEDAAQGSTGDAGGSKQNDATQAKAQETKLTVEELATEIDKPNVGSDQMDVDEVMGNAIDHLRAAWIMSTLDQPDAQDPIEGAFFSTFLDNRKKLSEDQWIKTTRSDRWVTAYPASRESKRAIGLHEALEASFDRDVMGGGTGDDIMTFTSIRDVAPHFHVYIQRSDGGTGKNNNSIIIPETLYLDRYMDSSGDLEKLRKRSWDMKARLGQLNRNPAVVAEAEKILASEPAIAVPWVSAPAPTKEYDNPPSQEDLDSYVPISGMDCEDWSLVNTPNVDLRAIKAKYPTLKRKAAQIDLSKAEEGKPSSNTNDQTHRAAIFADPTAKQFRGSFEKQLVDQYVRLFTKRAALFSDLKNVKYRLHAVVCHSGSTSAGHYWVWIRDFDKNVWHKYNDSTVTVHSEDFVLEQLKGSEPYYLAYVRDRDLSELVSVPTRPRDVGMEPLPPPAPEPAQDSLFEDVTMTGMDDIGISAGHVENAGPVLEEGA